MFATALIAHVRSLMDPEIARHCVFASITSIEDLVEGSCEIEASLMNSRPTATPAASTSLRPWRYCPKRHYHADCPVLKDMKKAGNAQRGAAANTATPEIADE